MLDKRALRTRLRALRAGHAATAGMFPAPAAFTDTLTANTVVATYSPIGGEADPVGFDRAVRSAMGELTLPHVIDNATPIRFLRWQPDTDLVRGPFGLRQPPADAEEVTPAIILTPLIGFDRRGNRLGQGAGHYDRAFARHPAAWRIGIAWSVQEVDDLPTDGWDVPLHAIATEHEWIIPS